MNYKLSADEFLERFELELKRNKLHMEEKIALQGLDFVTLQNILGPCSECEDVGDFAGPVALWHFGDEKNICVLILHKALNQLHISARQFVPKLDKYPWSILTEITFLPKDLFNDVCWVIYTAQISASHLVGRIYFDKFEIVSQCSSLSESEELIIALKQLGSNNKFEVRQNSLRTGSAIRPERN